MDNRWYNIWEILISTLSVSSTFISLFYAGFKVNQFHKQLSTDTFNKIMEAMFWTDMFLQFFLEYRSSDRYLPIRDHKKIALKYLKENFILDLLSLMPFEYFVPEREDWVWYDYTCLLFLQRILRLRKAAHQFSPRYFAFVVKSNFDKSRSSFIRRKVKSNEGFDPYEDNNMIVLQVKIIYLFKVIRMACIIFMISYSYGILWWIFISIEKQEPEIFEDDTGTNFMDFFSDKLAPLGADKVDLREDSRNVIIMIYFSITTLTTIGFGDYTPRNNIERIIILFTLLFGVMIFSIIMQMFLEVIEKLNMVEKENEDADNLSRFLGLMTKFNHNRILETEHIR